MPPLPLSVEGPEADRPPHQVLLGGKHDATRAAAEAGDGSGADSGAPGAGRLHKGSQRWTQLRHWLARQAAQALKDARRSLLTGIIVCIILTSMVLLLKELGYYLLHRKRIEDLDM